MPEQRQQLNSRGKRRKERIEYARSRDILDVAHELNMELFRSGRDYRWKEHDSFVITPEKNVWKWFSQNLGGDTISLVETIKGINFNQTIDFLNDGQFKEFSPGEQTASQEVFRYYLEPYEQPFKEAREYLKEQRGLSDATIDFFLEKGVLAQANAKLNDSIEPVVVFKSLDFSGEIIGANLQGIEENWNKWPTRGRAKNIIRNSDGTTGMRVDIGQPQRLIFTESPIDLMSYYELHKDDLQDVRLVSMDGLKEASVGRQLAELQVELSGRPLRWSSEELAKGLDMAIDNDYFSAGKHSDMITLAVDNDEGGRNFISSLQGKGVPVRIDVPPIISERAEKTDWNDYLKSTTELETEYLSTVSRADLPENIQANSSIQELLGQVEHLGETAYFWVTEEDLEQPKEIVSQLDDWFSSGKVDEFYKSDRFELTTGDYTYMIEFKDGILSLQNMEDYAKYISKQIENNGVDSAISELKEVISDFDHVKDSISLGMDELLSRLEKQPLQNQKELDQVTKDDVLGTAGETEFLEISISQIQEDLSTEGNLVGTPQSDGQMLYTQVTDIGQGYQLELAVYSPEMVDSLEDIQAPWTVAVIKENETLGYLAYGSDWGNEFQIADELERFAEATQVEKVSDILYKPEEVATFLETVQPKVDEKQIHQIQEVATEKETKNAREEGLQVTFLSSDNVVMQEHYSPGDVVSYDDFTKDLYAENLRLFQENPPETSDTPLKFNQDGGTWFRLVDAEGNTLVNKIRYDPGEDQESISGRLTRSFPTEYLEYGQAIDAKNFSTTAAWLEELERNREVESEIEVKLFNGEEHIDTVTFTDLFNHSDLEMATGELGHFPPSSDVYFAEINGERLNQEQVDKLIDRLIDEGVENEELSQMLAQPGFSLKEYAQREQEAEAVSDNLKAPDLDNQGQQKNDRINVSKGSLQPEAEGSAIPVLDETSTVEPAVTSHPTLSSRYLHFNTEGTDVSRVRRGYHVINQKDLSKLNNFAPMIQEMANWYREELSSSDLLYVVKNGLETDIVRLTFEDKNFPHLTGILPVGKKQTAEKTLHDFADGNGHFENILLAQQNNTFKKLGVLPNLKSILDPNSFYFDDLSDIKRFNRMNIAKAIQSDDNDILLAFRTTEENISYPASLLKVKGSVKTDIESSQRKVVLGIYRERDGNIEQIAVNEEHIHDNGEEMLSILKNKQYESSVESPSMQENENLQAAPYNYQKEVLTGLNEDMEFKVRFLRSENEELAGKYAEGNILSYRQFAEELYQENQKAGAAQETRFDILTPDEDIIIESFQYAIGTEKQAISKQVDKGFHEVTLLSKIDEAVLSQLKNQAQPISPVNEQVSELSQQQVPPVNPIKQGLEKRVDQILQQSEQAREKKQEERVQKNHKASLSQSNAGMEKADDFNYMTASAYELSQKALDSIREYTRNPEDMKEYLDFMSKFPNLSPRNVALIQKQWPGADAVATYDQWQAMGKALGIEKDDVFQTSSTFTNKRTGKSREVPQANLSVKFGEKAKITLFRPEFEKMIPVLDENGYQLKNSKGNPQFKPYSKATPQEETLVKAKKIEVRKFQKRNPKTGQALFAPYKVFELSQTTLKPESYPKLIQHYNFDLDQVKTKEVLAGLNDYAKSIGVTIAQDETHALGNARGAFYPYEQKILLNPSNTPGEKVSTTIHELAHASLHNPNGFMDLPKGQKELEAEMTSYLVSNHFGLDTSQKTIGYIASWTNNLKQVDDKQLSDSLKRIHKTSSKIVKEVEKHTKPYQGRQRGQRPNFPQAPTRGPKL